MTAKDCSGPVFAYGARAAPLPWHCAAAIEWMEASNEDGAELRVWTVESAAALAKRRTAAAEHQQRLLERYSAFTAPAGSGPWLLLKIWVPYSSESPYVLSVDTSQLLWLGPILGPPGADSAELRAARRITELLNAQRDDGVFAETREAIGLLTDLYNPLLRPEEQAKDGPALRFLASSGANVPAWTDSDTIFIKRALIFSDDFQRHGYRHGPLPADFRHYTLVVLHEFGHVLAGDAATRLDRVFGRFDYTPRQMRGLTGRSVLTAQNELDADVFALTLMHYVAAGGPSLAAMPYQGDDAAQPLIRVGGPDER